MRRKDGVREGSEVLVSKKGFEHSVSDDEGMLWRDRGWCEKGL